MMATYPPHPNQLQHNVPQPALQPGHPGQPNPHAMQHLHPNSQAFAHQQNMQMVANNPAAAAALQQQQQQQNLIRQRQMMMNNMSAGANQGINPENRQMVTRGFLPNGMIAGAGGNPQHLGMGGFPGAGGPHMRSHMLPAHLQNNVNAAAAAMQQQQQQQQQLQQLGLANPNVHATNQAMNMQQVNAAQNQAVAQQMAAQAAAVAAVRGQQQQKPMIGQSILKLHHFFNVLGTYESEKLRQVPDFGIMIWRRLVGDIFSSNGTLRLSLWQAANQETKQFDIQNHVLPRFFSTIMQNGIKSLQIVAEHVKERELSNNQGTLLESKCTMIYWFPNGGCCFHRGFLRAHYNPQLLIEVLDIAIHSHDQYVLQSQIQQNNASNFQDPSDAAKNSPRSKAKRAAPSQPPIPDNNLTSWGVPQAVIRCLEVLEIISFMRDLFHFQQQNPALPPSVALQTLVKQINQNQQMVHHAQQQAHAHAHAVASLAANAAAQGQGLQNQQGHPGGPSVNGPGQIHPSPHMNLVPGGMANSPSVGEARLVPPSPHIGGQAPSPAQNHLQAPGLAHNPSQQQHPISNPNSQTPTTVGSAGTSPNQPQKRRRPSSSQIKNEGGEDGEANAKVKQSPRGGPKRMKPNPT